VNSQWRVWAIAALAAAVLFGAIYFPFLRHSVKKQAQAPQPSEEKVRQELTEAVEANPSEPRVKAQMFWAADENDSGLAPVTIELPLSSNPTLRAKEVLNTLIAGPVDADLRTLPPDAVLLAFYLLPDGTAVADFSDALATSTPSGIQSEQLAVDSMVQTLAANVPQVKRLQILIHGQVADTLAGHVDLTQPFVVNASATTSAPTAAPATSTPPAAAGQASGQSTPTSKPGTAPVSKPAANAAKPTNPQPPAAKPATSPTPPSAAPTKPN
jgi:Sporulation and spore germination